MKAELGPVSSNLNEGTKTFLDVGSIVLAWGSVLQLMPALAALLSSIWMVTRLYEYFVEKRTQYRLYKTAKDLLKKIKP